MAKLISNWVSLIPVCLVLTNHRTSNRPTPESQALSPCAPSLPVKGQGMLEKPLRLWQTTCLRAQWGKCPPGSGISLTSVVLQGLEILMTAERTGMLACFKTSWASQVTRIHSEQHLYQATCPYGLAIKAASPSLLRAESQASSRQSHTSGEV